LYFCDYVVVFVSEGIVAIQIYRWICFSFDISYYVWSRDWSYGDWHRLHEFI